MRRGAAAEIHRRDAAEFPFFGLAADLRDIDLPRIRRFAGFRRARRRLRSRNSCNVSRKTAGADTARDKDHAWLPAISSSSSNTASKSSTPTHALIFPRCSGAPGRPSYTTWRACACARYCALHAARAAAHGVGPWRYAARRWARKGSSEPASAAAAWENIHGLPSAARARS